MKTHNKRANGENHDSGHVQRAVPGKRNRVQNRYAGVVQRTNDGPADTQSARTGDRAHGKPFENGVTRGDFVWALARARPDLGYGQENRDEVVTNAMAQGVLGGGVDDAINRADAATILARMLDLSLALPDQQVAYFYDVPPNVYYHETAHAARVHGIFLGGGDNLFRPGDTLSAQEAGIVIERAKNPQMIAPEQQTNGAEPMLSPNAALGLLSREELGADDISLVRKAILQLPEEQRADLYRQLNSKVTYRNQRDNAGTYTFGDYMCNVTSIAMAFNQLGYGADESEKQFEDQLDEGLQEAHGLPADNEYNPRYKQWGQRELANARDIDVQRVTIPALGSAGDVRAWFQDHVQGRMEQGQAANMSIKTHVVGSGHIVRVEWVEPDGVRVDDPFGALQEGGGYAFNDKTTAEDGGARGEDNLWTWERLASSRVTLRYVQFYQMS